jgi:hypothetical protein
MEQFDNFPIAQHLQLNSNNNEVYDISSNFKNSRFDKLYPQKRASRLDLEIFSLFSLFSYSLFNNNFHSNFFFKLFYMRVVKKSLVIFDTENFFAR